MGKFLVKLRDGETDYYLEWSTIVDAPVTYGMSLDELKDYVREEYGRQGMKDFDERLERLERTGTTLYDDRPVAQVLAFNRAGKDETCLTIEQIVQAYCREAQDPVEIVGRCWDEDE